MKPKVITAIVQWIGRNMPVTLVKLRYFIRFKKLPNLKNPQNLNEKILWQKLYADISDWVLLADKYKVREYVEKIGLANILVKLYGHWDNVNDINFDELPNELIFKANNGDGKGTNLPIHDLKTTDKNKLRKIIQTWLNDKHVGDLSAEPQYRAMHPIVIAEELLPLQNNEQSLCDYKIWCINGKAQYIMTCTERNENSVGLLTYDLHWHPHPEFSIASHKHFIGKELPPPKNLELMIKIAEKLANGFPILRVDLYNINGKIYFGEMTFTSLGGMMNYYTPEFLQMMGNKADISNLKKVRNI